MQKSPKKIPFDFILDLLAPLTPRTNPMFGSYGVYVGEMIVLVLRHRDNHSEVNGVWIATDKINHESLRKDFPSMTSIYILSDGKGETNWQMIPEHADDFESSAIKLCELILLGDPRIGKIPKPKKKKTNTDSTNAKPVNGKRRA